MGLFKNNIVIGILVLILISAGGAYYLFQKPANEDLLVSDQVGGDTVGRDLLASLITLKSLKFDKEIFDDPTFKSFLDFSIQIPDEPYGRPNPFYPIGADASAVKPDTSKDKTTQ